MRGGVRRLRASDRTEASGRRRSHPRGYYEPPPEAGWDVFFALPAFGLLERVFLALPVDGPTREGH